MWEAPGELLTVFAGGVVGLICSQFRSAAVRRSVWVVLSVVLGGMVSWINGELPTFPAFLIFDVPVVAVVALGVILVVRRLQLKTVSF
jgi:hypothetical protein